MGLHTARIARRRGTKEVRVRKVASFLEREIYAEYTRYEGAWGRLPKHDPLSAVPLGAGGITISEADAAHLERQRARLGNQGDRQ